MKCNSVIGHNFNLLNKNRLYDFSDNSCLYLDKYREMVVMGSLKYFYEKAFVVINSDGEISQFLTLGEIVVKPVISNGYVIFVASVADNVSEHLDVEGNVLCVYDAEKKTVNITNIKFPSPGRDPASVWQYTSAVMGSSEYAELLVCGWIRMLYDKEQMQQLQLPPYYILKWISHWFSRQEYHVLATDMEYESECRHIVFSWDTNMRCVRSAEGCNVVYGYSPCEQFEQQLQISR